MACARALIQRSDSSSRWFMVVLIGNQFGNQFDSQFAARPAFSVPPSENKPVPFSRRSPPWTSAISGSICPLSLSSGAFVRVASSSVQPKMPRYQPLSLDPSAPSSFHRPTPPVRQHNSPFYCTCCIPLLQQLGSFFPFPSRKELAGYAAGALFAFGWWAFIDGVVYASTREPSLPNEIRFEDYVPGILSTLSLIIVNLIDSSALNGDEFSFGNSNSAYKARLCAFMGIAMALGALGGAVGITVVKYVLTGMEGDAFYFGYSVIVQNVLIFASSMVLWFGRNSAEEESIALY
ncbi:uncharacterized protein BJ171DRAFT_496585 [Polychytrium aggregatum]|uniref:uncharacterized protein n=1 Tax=Polychytrium aggregatum TaxID=110093 RepID=UPI0022FE8A12|nr:uncharacterized protein BJ171DRAFT_496585 [Polychytrium aggregatum]KAI9206683.1 hypothetical protein BJ171DRAFT_496585 [Polychytrium aggregatum]